MLKRITNLSRFRSVRAFFRHWVLFTLNEKGYLIGGFMCWIMPDGNVCKKSHNVVQFCLPQTANLKAFSWNIRGRIFFLKRCYFSKTTLITTITAAIILRFVDAPLSLHIFYKMEYRRFSAQKRR